MKTATDYVRSVIRDHGDGLKEHHLYETKAYPSDPHPRFLAGRRTNMTYGEEKTVGNLRKHLMAALAALDTCADDGPIPLAEVDKGVAMFEALDQLDYFYPEVEAWCVFRNPNAEGSWERVYCGCLTEEQAQRLLKVVSKHEEAKESDRLVVKKMPCRVQDIVHPDMPDDQLTRNWS
jgi:hypothetical protein